MIESSASTDQPGPVTDEAQHRARQRRAVAEAIGRRHDRRTPARQPPTDQPTAGAPQS